MYEMIVWQVELLLFYYVKIINKGLISFQTDCVKATGCCKSTVKYEIFEPLAEAELETPVSPTPFQTATAMKLS